MALILGPVQYFCIPSRSGDGSDPLDGRSLSQKLAKVDYAGALSLVISCPTTIRVSVLTSDQQAASVFLLLFSFASPEITVIPIVLCMATFGVFLAIESRFASEPIIPIKVLRMRSVLLTCLAGLISMIARWSVLFFTPVYAMVVRDWSPASAGLILVPTNAGFGLGGVLVGWIHIRKTGSYYM